MSVEQFTINRGTFCLLHKCVFNEDRTRSKTISLRRRRKISGNSSLLRGYENKSKKKNNCFHSRFPRRPFPFCQLTLVCFVGKVIKNSETCCSINRAYQRTHKVPKKCVTVARDTTHREYSVFFFVSLNHFLRKFGMIEINLHCFVFTVFLAFERFWESL